MGDRYIRFPLRAVVVPFAASYEPLLVACGQIALWLSVLLIASFHVRRRIGGRAWRQLHYASFAVFWLAFVHGIALGTETATLWAFCLYLATSCRCTACCRRLECATCFSDEVQSSSLCETHSQ